jgi:hypothetical protein
MNLKKNDKIILIVGVVILVVAGIGIAFYTSPVNEKPVGEAKADTIIYTYTWTQNTGEKTIGDALTAGKGAPYEEPIFIQGQSGTVITSVEFQLDWEDDVTYGILRKKGLDTLTADISYKTDTKSETSTGNGNHTFVFTINERPKDGTIEAKSREDAVDQIQNNISGKNSVSFDITVSVDTGESFIRLLKFLKDKGNDFSLTATYTYYTMSLQESEPSDDDTDDDTKETGDDGFNHNVGEFYVKLGYGRGMI